MTSHIETKLVLPEELAKKVERVAELADVSPQDVIKVMLAAEAMRWQEGVYDSPPAEGRTVE